MNCDLRHHLYTLAAWLFTILLWLVFSGSVMAAPYDAYETRPGDTIRNEMLVSWGNPSNPPAPVSASDEFGLVPFDLPGTLRAFKYDPSGSSYAVHETGYSTGDASGPFSPVPAPKDPSGNPIALSEPVPLSETDRILKGTTVFLVLEDASLNFSASASETVIVTVTDSITGDIEYLRLTETGPDSGIFTGYFHTLDSDTRAADGIIATHAHARIDVVYTDPWRSDRHLENLVLVGPVDPYGILFDSRTGLPVDGATITIIDDATGEPAQVFGEDLIASYPSTIVTGSTVTDSSGREYVLEEGQYRFPFVNLGKYHFEIDAPLGYVAPSLVADETLQTLDGAPFALGDGSRLDSFEIVAGPPIEIDVPLDGEGFITVTRTGSADELEQGDFIQFTVTVGTNIAADIVGTVHDILPKGLRILPDTVLVDDATPSAVPELSATGREIDFPEVTFPNGDVARITYIAQVTPQAKENSLLTSSSTADAQRLLSNTATHDLGVLSTFGLGEDILLGQVFGTACDARYDPSLDLSGIRVMLEDGTYSETDANGRFTFRAIARGSHVVALDPLSVPAGFEPVLCQNTTQKAGSPYSRFVEAQGGFSRQVFFTLTPTSFDDHPDAIPPVGASSSAYNASWQAQHPNLRGLVFPPQYYLPSSRSIDIVGVRDPGTLLTAFVNGEKVGSLNKRPSRTGAAGAIIDMWKGVALHEGSNEVRLLTTNASGTTLREDIRTVLYNNEIAHISIDEDTSILSSDGRTRPVVTFRITGPQDIPLHPGTMVNMAVDAPHKFSVTQIVDGKAVTLEQPTASGIVDPDGLLRLRLAPVRRPGSATFHAFNEEGQVRARAFIGTEGRPFTLVGIASGTLSHKAISEHMEDRGESAFGELDQMQMGGRTALFAQGVIRGKWLLTARYDSALAEQDGDFFDVDPEADYIVYGDQSVEGDAASSRHALYLRLQSDMGDFLYGDFDTGIDAGVASYARRLTGARVLFGNDVLSVTAFLSDTSQSFVEDKFAADGTTGPFMLSRQDVLAFSETIIVETTNRNDPGEVIESTELTRGRDYDIDYSAGRIFLSDPLLSRDASLNPNALVVRYEIESEDSSGIIVGGRATVSLSDEAAIGVTAVHEDNISGSDGNGELFGVDGSWQFSDTLSGSLAMGYSRQQASSELPDGAEGHSAEARLQYLDDMSEIEAYLRQESTSYGIQNDLAKGEEVISAGLTASHILSLDETQNDEGDTITRSRAVEASLQAERNQDTGKETLEAEAAHVRTKNNTIRTIGLRSEHATQTAEAGTNLKLFGNVEHETTDGRLRFAIGQEMTVAEDGSLDSPDRGILSLEYAATDALTLRASNEIAFAKDLRVDIVSFGADVDIWDGGILDLGTVTASGATGSHSVAHAGIDQTLSLDDKTSLSFGLERQAPIAGDFEAMSPITEAGLSNPRLEEGFWAIHAGFERSGNIWKTSGLSEYRDGDTSSQARLRLTGSRELRDDLALGAQATFFVEDGEIDGREQEHELLASLAWRPLDQRFALLDQLRAKYDEADSLEQARLINSIFLSRQLEGGHEVNLRHGIKFARFGFGNDHYSDILNLAGAEYRHQVTDWMDFGLHGTALHSIKARSTDYSAGASIGVTPFENGWISLGYNWTGFRDEDFSANGETARGAFVQFRMKFDQATLSKLALH